MLHLPPAVSSQREGTAYQLSALAIATFVITVLGLVTMSLRGSQVGLSLARSCFGSLSLSRSLYLALSISTSLSRSRSPFLSLTLHQAP